MSKVEISLPAPAFKELFATPEMPDLGPRRRAGTLSVDAVNARLDEFFTRTGKIIARQNQELIRSAVLLWHDHFDASHEISQGIGTPDGSFLHGILHRREPDYWNAKYWFRRVGSHACYPAIARTVGEFLAAKNQSALASRLVPRGHWDAFAFVDACEEAANPSAAAELRDHLRAVQQIEFNLLLAHLCAGRRGAA
ncbi:MAG: hypothetical protein HZA89_16030 [Verrucomicrobia bacterium]|nr:hypothetical protein [Verrucomicrobiota bacterium]